MPSFERVASAAEAREASPQVVSVGGRTLGLFHHEGEFYAVDNRCPHMGFPLTDGSVDDGILTCPWHHARFELSGGDTFDPFADDVRTFPVEVRDGDVYVDPDPERETAPEEHWRERLEHGLQESLRLVIDKAIIGLDDAGVEPTVPLTTGATFGTQYRRMGWGSGLTTMSAMANLLPDLRPADRRRALAVGLGAVADDCAGEPPFFVQDPLSTDRVAADRLIEWFRDTIEVRDADGAERVLRAAIEASQTPREAGEDADLDEAALVRMFVAAATDHRYLDTGHRLDFVNKAVELLDRIGWDHADTVLPSLVPALADADRAEERSSWRQPIDVAALVEEASDDLPTHAGAEATWTEPDDFVDRLLDDDPHAIMDALTDAIEAGATGAQLAGAVADAAARRIAQFGTANEFRDWNTVHHTYTYANAVCGLAKRTDAPEIYRAVFDGAVSVYLDRFLNTPPIPLPDPDGDRDPDTVLDDLLETFEVEADETVGAAGRHTAEYLASGGDPARLKRALGEVLLREDAGFHPRQNVEAAFSRYDAADEEERGRLHLVATARYLAAHTPTRREGEQTFRIAERLNRGEAIHEA
ncbi:Rieske (2Fe-2S) protein [Haloplanus aerogenes]|uniref:Nitrite reductase/ring-hydroxylating ferredoxin subunit n=1 Tax=Haloplanus aerogenes TaxID=660522 RepID=A0A3M0DQY0_9EURY|nr:Rieske 2Fe-2S domain-containing protein [Haloplanus aerogenes]AZH24365.1 Rieske (2Fe-2S) protein [Haloplanus aerogenes]RMB23997.1 nitrite reductase/ring-hydroxylating ferredoxin subunit [Haloplanus aerogenes]